MPGSGADAAGAPAEKVKLLGNVRVWPAAMVRPRVPLKANAPVIGSLVLRMVVLKSPAAMENGAIGIGIPPAIRVTPPVAAELPLRLPSIARIIDCVGSSPIPVKENESIGFISEHAAVKHVTDVEVTRAVAPLNAAVSGVVE